jgi:hypothetical protein
MFVSLFAQMRRETFLDRTRSGISHSWSGGTTIDDMAAKRRREADQGWKGLHPGVGAAAETP